MSFIVARRPRRAFICATCIRTLTLTTTTTQPTSTPSNPAIKARRTRGTEPLPTSIPPYPYGPARWYKQSDLGLYGGARIQYGNNVAEGFKDQPNGVKTRRSWGVNWFRKRLWSNALNDFVRLRVSARVLRTIDKVGGLDEYLIGEKEGRVKGLGLKGWELRWAVMQSKGMRRRFNREGNALGLQRLRGEVARLEAQAAAEQELEEEIEEELVEEDVGGDAAQPSHLKIRTGKDEHMVLTHQGWTRIVKHRKNPQANQDELTANYKQKFTAARNRKIEGSLNSILRARAQAQEEASQAADESNEPLPVDDSLRPTNLTPKQRKLVLERVKRELKGKMGIEDAAKQLAELKLTPGLKSGRKEQERDRIMGKLNKAYN